MWLEIAKKWWLIDNKRSTEWIRRSSEYLDECRFWNGSYLSLIASLGSWGFRHWLAETCVCFLMKRCESQIWVRIFPSISPKPLRNQCGYILKKKALARVSCHSFLPQQQRQTKNNVSAYLIHLFMRVIEILTQMVRRWRLTVFSAQIALNSPRK